MPVTSTVSSFLLAMMMAFLLSMTMTMAVMRMPMTFVRLPFLAILAIASCISLLFNFAFTPA